jgi:glycosyltransferase involved in cell wall biosynthesis
LDQAERQTVRPLDLVAPKVVAAIGSAGIPEPEHGATGRFALFIRDLSGGGSQKMSLVLAKALAQRGHEVDLVLTRREGSLSGVLPEGIRVIELARSPEPLGRLYALAADPGALPAMLGPALLPIRPLQSLPYLPALVRFLRQSRPDVLVASLPPQNLVALWAKQLAGVHTRVIVREHSHLSLDSRESREWRDRLLPPLVRRSYPAADAVVAVSEGLAEDLSQLIAMPRERITTVYNPVVDPDLLTREIGAPDHAWFAPSAPPVVLSAGRLARVKDFPTLLRAFARVRASREARLVILGEGRGPQKTDKRRAELLSLAEELGIAKDVMLPGFVSNPLSYMAHASVFVVSSIHEGLSNVLVEALACGCPVVSTDCPHGPAEILDGGRYGALVPVGDAGALAAAIERTLANPPSRADLRARAALFSVERAVDQYLRLLLPGSGPARTVDHR